jgi:hypothetical protein
MLRKIPPGKTAVREKFHENRCFEKVLLVDWNHVHECATLWNSGEYFALEISDFINFDEVINLADLIHFKAVAEFHFCLRRKVDIAPLKLLSKTLTELWGDEFNSIQNLEDFPVLRVLRQSWSKEMSRHHFQSCLEVLLLDKYLPSNSSGLSDLPSTPNLRSLELVVPGIKDLNEIDRYPKLEYLDIYSARKLVSIADLERCSSLKRLELCGCKKINDLQETLSKCSHLERLVLEKVSDLENIQFIELMPNLKWLNLMDTNVIDGDMSPLLRHPSLEYAVFTSKKHFSHTEAQVRAALQAKEEGMK